jgi:hypothetical protein
MQYREFAFITPPRAEVATPRTTLPAFERRKWWAQYKKNGTNSVIFVWPDRRVTAMNRHGENHKQWSFTPQSSKIFRELPGNGWYVFNAELLHSKIKGGPKDINYLHDVLVADGQYLFGETYARRYALLQRLFLHGEHLFEKSHIVLNERTWLARNYQEDFHHIFSSLNPPEDEGLVLKDPRGELAYRPADNAKWSFKCRLPTKNVPS